MRKNLGWLIGIIAGDGSISDRYVRVYSQNEEIIRKSRKAFRECLGVELGKIKTRRLSLERKGFARRTETVEITVNSAKLAHVVKALKDAYIACPTREFICGMFDAEGSVDLRGTVTLWQRKNEAGGRNMAGITSWLRRKCIEFTEIRNENFHILEIRGSYKHYENLKKFLTLVRFSVKHKNKDAKLILGVFRSHNLVAKEAIAEFAKASNFVTVRDIVENFHMPKMNAYTALNKLVKEKVLSKAKTYPNKYVHSRWHSTKR